MGQKNRPPVPLLPHVLPAGGASPPLRTTTNPSPVIPANRHKKSPLDPTAFAAQSRGLFTIAHSMERAAAPFPRLQPAQGTLGLGQDAVAGLDAIGEGHAHGQ